MVYGVVGEANGHMASIAKRHPRRFTVAEGEKPVHIPEDKAVLMHSQTSTVKVGCNTALKINK